jgi:hypothetical protein
MAGTKVWREVGAAVAAAVEPVGFWTTPVPLACSRAKVP